MGAIKSVYVEKKTGFDIEAGFLLEDLKSNVGIVGLESIRLINRYFVENLSDEAFSACVSTVFSEPTVDEIYFGLPDCCNDFVFGVKYLPGQFDQRADSAAQCIQIVTGAEEPLVETAKIYICKGELSAEDCLKIKQHCINPVDSSEASLDIPASLSPELTAPSDIATYDGFIKMNDDDIAAMCREMGLAMSAEDLAFCRDYFRDEEQRDPSFTEIKVIDTYWSDHCRHTTFATALEDIEVEDGKYASVINEALTLYEETRNNVYGEKAKTRDITLMDLATLGMKALRKAGKLNDLDQSEEINACSIEVTVDVDGKPEQWLLMFKNETHNHPTEIEPFGGAATCLGGAIRDPLSGRAYVYQAMRVTGAADPDMETMEGKLPQRKITTEAAHGYSSYGNQIGLATGLVNEIYHQGYAAKRMEIGAVVAAAKKENVIRERPSSGDVVILVGGRTGRDGCGGATGSSKEHDEQSILLCGAEVQKGNAPTERKLQRLFRNPAAARSIKRCNDFGAGGVSVAIGELAESININLDLVPKKYEGLNGTELAISESQERMAVVVRVEDAEKFIEYAEIENLEAAVVAEVRDDGRLIMTWRGDKIVNLSRAFLDTNGARHTATAKIATPELNQDDVPQGGLKQLWLDNLRDLNVCAQKGLGERFDGTIGRNSVLLPYGGKHRLTPTEVMAAKLPVVNCETSTASVMSYGYNPFITSSSPFHGAMLAVVESLAKLAAAGCDANKARLTFQEYFERMTEEPERWGKPLAALLGAFYAQMKLGVPAIGGKDSMSGTFRDLDVPPTLVSFAITTEDAGNIISPEFKGAGHTLAVLHTPYVNYDLPDFKAFSHNLAVLQNLIKQKKVISAHTIGFGGIAAAVSKMALGNNIGAKIEASNLFRPQYGSWVLELASGVEVDLVATSRDITLTQLGTTTDKPVIVANGTEISLDEAREAWLSRLENVFPTKMLEKTELADIELKTYSLNEKCASASKLAKPRVFIPVFPGTNCEGDTRARFIAAGAQVEEFVIKNLNVNMLEESLKEMARIISNSQIIAIPGGFSAGDEPDGSGRFIAAVFRNPRISEAVMELLNNRDGLMIGICNGFQALIKLGLVPEGKICGINAESPTLTYNTLGRHISTISRTKIISNKSPWLAKVNVGDVHSIPFSHGEGRFAASEEVIRTLEVNGQIATQYVDLDGNPSMDIRYNPNGSFYAIESITSPDGRVLGKMGHSERVGRNLYKNIEGNMEQHIFESGVEYFTK